MTVVYAALCTARADGTDPKFLRQAKHAVLVMVRASEADAENAITSLLRTKGWVDPAIQRLKLLDQPFHTDEPMMQTCYDAAVEKEGGIVVYSDPIADA
jgi:hypothetical protein